MRILPLARTDKTRNHLVANPKTRPRLLRVCNFPRRSVSAIFTAFHSTHVIFNRANLTNKTIDKIPARRYSVEKRKSSLEDFHFAGKIFRRYGKVAALFSQFPLAILQLYERVSQ